MKNRNDGHRKLAARREWSPPRIARVRAGEAEINFNFNTDGVIAS